MNDCTMPTHDFSFPPAPTQRRQGLNHGVRTALYVFGCTAVRDFAQPLGLTMYKVGLTSRRYVMDRMHDLRGRRYAGIVADLGDRRTTIRSHPKASEWFKTPLPSPAPGTAAADLLAQLPYGVWEQGVVTFRMPPGLALADLEHRFQIVLRPRNLNHLLDTEDGRERLRRVGLPQRARLFTDYDLIGGRRSIASEIFCIRPERELAVLLDALLLAIAQERQAAEKGTERVRR